MAKLRVYKWTFVACIWLLSTYVVVLAYRSTFATPWPAPELNVGILVLGSLIADIVFHLYQLEKVEARALEIKQRWRNEQTQPLRVVHSSTYRPMPVAPPMRRPGEQINVPFQPAVADLKGMLTDNLDQNEGGLRPRWDLEDTGDVGREAG